MPFARAHALCVHTPHTHHHTHAYRLHAARPADGDGPAVRGPAAALPAHNGGGAAAPDGWTNGRADGGRAAAPALLSGLVGG